jgi:outer membrane immunogenic protein
MKRMFWTLAALLLISASAPAMAQRSIYQWTGCYIGVSGGGTWGEAETDFNRVTPNGFIGGGQFGCDYQAPSNWVIGLQGEFNWADAQDRRMTGVLDLDTLDTRVNWFASATARFGYASGPWLLYGKGGAAWVRDAFKNFGNFFILSFDYNGSGTLSGWTAGVGVEYALAPNWSINFGYDYYDFGTESVSVSGVAGVIPAASTSTISVKQNFSVVKIGLNYRFGSN